MVSRENRSERGSMGFVEIKTWLDEVVDNRNEARSLEQFSSQIELNFIHLRYDPFIVHKGIEIIAAAIGEGLFYENIKSENFDFIAYFDYRSYRFQQYCRNGELDVIV